LSPPDEGRYRKFKLIIFAGIFLLLLVIGGGILALLYLLKVIF
jgi:hypothetical protein